MFKIKLLILAAVSLLGGYLVGGIVLADHLPLSNGDFETGTLSPWQTFTTPNGTLGTGLPKVAPFDTNGDGVATNSVQFKVGQVTPQTGVYEGGGIFQNVHLLAGDYIIRADIAVNDGGSLFGNAEGGLFELLVDGLVADSHNFVLVGPNETKRSLLAAVHVVAAGDHEVRIRITRPALEPTVPLTQLVDNVAVAPAVVNIAVAPAPEPFPGGGQPAEVDAFLTYYSPQSKDTELSAGTDSVDVDIIYGATIDPSSFKATLNQQPFLGFEPVKDKTQKGVAVRPLSPGRNELVLSVNGEKSDGKTANDQDRLTFVIK
jgi:hypothetical protein